MCRLSSIAVIAIVALIALAHAQDLEACLDSAGLITSFPGTNASFPDDILSWQRRITPTPAGVAWPRTADEVAAALACAREAKVLVAARDGGHCYGSYSLPNAGLTINMTNFQEVSYDDWLWKTHGARFPHVRANMVGLIGSSIGGGFGSLSRMLGTPMDFLQGATYMLYNGTVVNASRTENPDLFWALQGAGSSYGIILSLTTKTWKPTYQQAINYTIALADSSPGAGVDALLAIQDHYLAGRWPDELTMRWSLTAPPYTGSGFYWGNPDDFDALLEPLVAELPDGTQLTRTDGLEPFRAQLAAEGVPLRGFVNYRDTALTVDQWSGRLYGDNYAKLQQLKTVYDPEGMFTAHPQSIPLPGQQPPAAVN
ncbi:FAD-binding domain-containing protein [Colletotrichum zoysiae]|uniref:FAD-binding domain-containing protein n=1 Tax=Colletotrichum zoysiae TaxID=1216348 RepID=A0AAD9HBG3_9PEZI|nr:FAD-binding domain-containing protein [Colletotrichum zoysiae]